MLPGVSKMGNFPYIYLLLLTVPMFWGTSYGAAKIGMRELEPINMAMLRIIIAAIIFAFILVAMRRNNTIARHDIPKFIFLGFMAITSFFYIHFNGLQYTTSANAGLIMATTPIFAAVFCGVLGREKIGSLGSAGIIIAFCGVSVIITQGHFAGLFRYETLRGDGLILLNAIVWAGFTLYGTTILTKYRPFVAMAYIHICGALLFLPFAVLPNPFVSETLISQLMYVNKETLMAAIYLAAFCSVYSYYMWYTGIETIGAVRTVVFNYFNPVFAVLTGVFLLNEPFTMYVLSGGAMIILGVYLTNRRQENSTESAESSALRN